uniref:Uncharacterized protein n=1 Tax=Euplotes vanleeuwenhoeki TaxID=2794224 RepID=A0A7T1FUG3_9SPIT|nr:hypothetical protein KQ443_mgp05 [Euplotes vanleeuwenhoeki]QPM99273.1 hypothetical protein MitoLV_47 [Euplotes vanleeuwenhoeki]
MVFFHILQYFLSIEFTWYTVFEFRYDLLLIHYFNFFYFV